MREAGEDGLEERFVHELCHVYLWETRPDKMTAAAYKSDEHAATSLSKAFLHMHRSYETVYQGRVTQLAKRHSRHRKGVAPCASCVEWRRQPLVAEIQDA
jgi:hypothetical protein